MRRGSSSLSSSSADRSHQPRSDDVVFDIRSHSSSVTSSKNPVKFQIQKRTPAIQNRSDRTESSSRYGTVQKLVTPKSVADSGTRTEALKSLSLYTSEDSDSEHVNEVLLHSKSNKGDVNVASAKKGNTHEHRRVAIQPKVDDSSQSFGHQHHKKERSDARDRYKSESKRSGRSKERRSSKERDPEESKDILRSKTSRDSVKSADDRQHEKKRGTDEIAEADRSHRYSDSNMKKSRDSSRHSSEKNQQTQSDVCTSRQSNYDRHREVSGGLKEAKKPERDSSLIESKNRIPSMNKRKSPSRAEGDTSRRKSSDSISRSANKEMASTEAQPKPKAAENSTKVATDLKPARNDRRQHTNECKPDTAKTVEKLKSADRLKEKLPVCEKTSKVKDDGHVDKKKDEAGPSQDKKASSSCAVLSDKKLGVESKHDKVSTSSTSSHSSSGSASSSSSDSDSSSSSGSGSSSGNSSSSSDSSDEDEVAATKEMSGHVKSGLQKDTGKVRISSGPQKSDVAKDSSKLPTHSDSEKPEACYISEGVTKLGGYKQADETISCNMPVVTKDEHVASVETKEDVAVSDKPKNNEKSTDCNSEPAAVHHRVSEVQVSVPEASMQKCTVELYSPSFPTDGGWDNDVGGDAAGWSSSSESDVDEVPPPPPPPRPSSQVQSSSAADTRSVIDKDGDNCSSTVAKLASSNQAIAQSLNTAPDNNSSGSNSISDTGKPIDGGFNQKDRKQSVLPKPGDCRTKATPDDERSDFRRHDKKPVSDNRSGTELVSRHQDCFRSGHSNSRNRRSRSRSRSRERRRHTFRDSDGRRPQDQVDRHRGIVSDKDASRRRDYHQSESPSVVFHLDSTGTPPVGRSLKHSSSSSRHGQTSGVQQKSSSHGSYRSAPTGQPARNSLGRNAFTSDELVVVIDTDDEDEENIEEIPLPFSVPNIELDDIPLPVPQNELSNLTAKDGSISEIRSDEKKCDSPPPVVDGDEVTSEKQRNTEEEVVTAETESVDMDLDDSDDGSCQSAEKNVTAVETDGYKAPVSITGKIVSSISSQTQPGRDQTTLNSMSSETPTTFAFSWKRKLGADLLKAPKPVTLMSASVVTDASPALESENLVPVTSSTSGVQANSDQPATVKCQLLSDNSQSQLEESTELDVRSSYNAPVIKKSKIVENSSGNTAAAQQKPRRRFSDRPIEKSANLSDDLPSKPLSATIRNVQVVKAYHVLTGPQSTRQSGDGTQSDHSTAACSTSVGDTSEKLTIHNKTADSETTEVDAICGENVNSVSRISQMEQKPESCKLKDPVSTVVPKERRFSEHKRSRSPEPIKKSTEQRKSSTSHSEKHGSNKEKHDSDTTKTRERNSSYDDRKKQSSSYRHRRSDSQERHSSSRIKDSNSERDKSYRGNADVASVKKSDTSEHQRVDVQPKIDDNSQSSSYRHHRREHSDVRDRDRDKSERKRSSRSKERRSSRERQPEESKDVLHGCVTSRDSVKSASDCQHDKKSRMDEKAEAERFYMYSDSNSKKIHDSSRHTAENKQQTQCDTSTSRHQERSNSLKESKKSERDSLTVESRNRNYSNERFLVREEDIGHVDSRCESSQDQQYCLLSPSEWQKLPRHSKHSPPPSDRSERSISQYRRSLSPEHSPKYQRRESLREHVEYRPCLREDESRLHCFEKRSFDRDERSPARSRQDISCSRRSPPRKGHFSDDYTSAALDHVLPSSPMKREPTARSRRSTSRDRRYVERRESFRADRSSRSPLQSTVSRSRHSLQEELERYARRKQSDSTDRCSRSPVCKRRRESSDRQSGSHDRRSRSGSRELLTSPDSRKYHRSRSDKRGDSRSRHGSYSPELRPLRESRHTNRDIVQFLIDTGVIRSSKSDSKCHESGSVDVVPIAKSPSSFVSTAVSVAQSVARSVTVTATTTQVTTSSSSFMSSFPVVAPAAIMPGPITPQMPYVDNASVPYMACNPYPQAFPAAPAVAPSPWYPPPVMQPCSSFPNQTASVPYAGMQSVPAVPGVGPGPPPVVQQCPVPSLLTAPVPDYHGSYGSPNRFPKPMNHSSFRRMQDQTIKPLLTYAADMNTVSAHCGSADRPKQEPVVRQHHSANSALIKAIESAVWVPSVDSSTRKVKHQMTESKSSALSEKIVENKVKVEAPATDSTASVEPMDKKICEKPVEVQHISDLYSAVQTSPAGCLWECIPEMVVDANSLASMEAENKDSDLALESDVKSKKRRRGQSASDSSRETRRRSSRLRSKEEQKKLDTVEEDNIDQLPDVAPKSVSDTELMKPPVKNLKARILQDYESDTGHSNLSSSGGMAETCLDAAVSTNSAAEAVYKIPDDSYSPMVTKPEKVKSRWRRWSELETDGDQDRAPPPPPPFQSPSSTTGTPATSVTEDENLVEEKPPYFEQIVDNIFLSLRLVTLHFALISLRGNG